MRTHRAFKKMPTGNLEGMTEQGAKLALKKSKTWSPELFKGIGPKTMGKWATKASRWAGPVVAVGSTIYDVYQVFRQEQQVRQQMERQETQVPLRVSVLSTEIGCYSQNYP